jgi:hypothetical protein
MLRDQLRWELVVQLGQVHPTATLLCGAMHDEAIERATVRLREAAEGRTSASDVEAVLERARVQIEALAQTADELQGALPDAVGNAVREGVRSEALPVARQIAEVRGLSSQLVRRLERIEGAITAERNERVDDLALLVDLVVTGWRSIDERLAHVEEMLGFDERTGAYDRTASADRPGFDERAGSDEPRAPELPVAQTDAGAGRAAA